uniref:Uncharacterized protein n=1 Tax=Arundo donax TaxID=35708 RepID=A0A0A9DZ11_ARUDO
MTHALSALAVVVLYFQRNEYLQLNLLHQDFVA